MLFEDLPAQYKKIVLVENRFIAEVYMNELYKHNVELILVSADKTYPRHPHTRKRVWECIQNDPEIQIVVLSRTSMKHLKHIESTNVTLLHDLINPKKTHYSLELTPAQLALIIHCNLLLQKQEKYNISNPVGSGAYMIHNNTSIPHWRSLLIYENLYPKYEVEKITWRQCKEVWLRDLWKGREDVKPMSSQTHDGENDISIYEQYEPTFFGVKEHGEIIAVNSGHKTALKEYRSRGLWVQPNRRGRQLGKLLLQATIKQAIDEHSNIVWTMPRNDSLYTYETVGFERTGDWIEQDYGVNCRASVKTRHLKLFEKNWEKYDFTWKETTIK